MIVPPLSFPVMLHELPPEGGELSLIGLDIRAFPVDHGGIPCYGFRMTSAPEERLSILKRRRRWECR